LLPADEAESAMRPVVLCILDGWGLNPSREGNAVAQGHTPNFDRIWATCPHAQLAAHGPDVGLPDGQMGNSEVGHMNIGAGRVVWMDLPRIDNAIIDGSFAANPALAGFVAAMKASGGTAHLAGLASPGGVHAHQRHIAAAAAVIAAAGVAVAVHAFLDGRDVPPQSAAGQIAELEAALPPLARIATVSGRFYAMDRDKRWERVAAAVAAILRGEGPKAPTAEAAIAAAYARGETDEFVTPTVIGDYAGAADGDGLFFANFRADRARQILGALVDPGFDGFAVASRPKWAALLGMVQYSGHLDTLMPAMFPSDDIVNTIGAWVAGKGLKQFRLAETEKYPHVTFFLNGGVEVSAAGELRTMAPSPKVRTYDLAPEMAAAEVTEQFVAAIRSGEYALIVVNYANPDMVGHTGVLEAAISAVEAVDRGLGEALAALDEAGGAMIVTADHGNCEVMIDPVTGGPHTAHTLNPVPVVLVGGPAGARLRNGRLADLAPSLLALMGIAPPPEMTGQSLIVMP
jgi:2,3-bisphosphoglycerate-independent phosphoglycerate mutase